MNQPSLPPAAPPPPVLLQGEDGEVYRATPDKVAAAIAKGFRPLTPEEQLRHQVAKEEEAKGALGSVVEGGKSALNQALFGVPGAYTEETETPEERAHREAVEDYHKTARLLGGVAGVGASLLAGGAGMFRGAELAGQAVERGILPAVEAGRAGLATKMAATAASYATQGAVLASPQAIVQAAFGDPKKAAETLLWGVGAGAALGAGSELLSSGASAAVEGAGKILKSEKVSGALEDYAQRTTPTAIGAGRAQTNKLDPDWLKETVDYAHERGFMDPGMSKSDIAAALKTEHANLSGQIGETYKALDGAIDKAKPEVLAAALKPGQLGREIRNAFDSAEMKMPMNADMASALEKVAASADALPTRVVDGQEVVPFEDAQNFITQLRARNVKAIGRAQNASPGGLQVATPLDTMKGEAYQVVKKIVHDAGDEVAKASDQPELVGKLVKDKRALAKTVELEKWAANNAAREAGNREVGLTDFLHMGEGGFAGKTMQAAGAGIGAAIGGPAGAIVGSYVGKVPGMALDYITKHLMEDKGLIVLSGAAKRAAAEGPEVFSAVLASESGLRLAATMKGVQDTVRRLATTGVGATAARTQAHMAHLLGSTQGLTPDQAYAKAGARLGALASNPEAMANVTSALSAPLTTTAPEVAQAYQEKTAQALAYLHQAFPKAVAPPAPFAPQTWAPSAAEKLAWHDKAEIVANPMAAMRHVAQGTLSPAHVEALQTIYPQIHAQMKQEALTFSATHPDVKLPLRERQSLAMFVGGSLDTLDTPDQLRTLQSAYASPTKPASEDVGGSAPTKKAKVKDMPGHGSAFQATQSAGPIGAT